MPTPRLTSMEAASTITDGSTLVTSGFCGIGHAESITRALELRWEQERHPKDLTLVYAAGQGDRKVRGLNHLGHHGLLKRVIGGHWLSAPRLGALVAQDAIEAWNLPQGIIVHLFRAIAAGKSGVVSKIGLHTFVDPRHDGARLTACTTKSALEPRVQVVTLGGEEQLFYPGFKIDFALLRATTADENGNCSTEEEPFHADLLAIAQAAHNSGGKVIVQVKRVVPAGTLKPNDVRLPGILVDALVVVEDPTRDHQMTFNEDWDESYRAAPATRPTFCAVAGSPVLAGSHLLAGNSAEGGAEGGGGDVLKKLNIRRIIQRRGLLRLMEIEKNMARRPVINLGIGVPAGIATVAQEEHVANFVLSVEAGPIGGTPQDGWSFGASAYPECVIDHAQMFDFIDGGGLDAAFLGLAEFDTNGNVNVSRFGEKMSGLGGFMNISQSTKTVVFMGQLTTGGLKVACKDGKLQIVQEGRAKKLVPHVSHLSFNGPYMNKLGREIMYITERAVFCLREGVLVLTEIAPGIDLHKDVLAVLGAPVMVDYPLKIMDPRIFREGPMLPRSSL